MKPKRRVELHQQGVVVLEPDAQGNIKRDQIDKEPKPGDWYFSPDGSKVVLDEKGRWQVAIPDPLSLEEILAAEDEKKRLLESARPLMEAIDHCERAMRPEHGTLIFNIDAEGVAETHRSIKLDLPRSNDKETRRSIITHEDSVKIFANVREVLQSRLDAIKAKLKVS